MLESGRLLAVLLAVLLLLPVLLLLLAVLLAVILLLPKATLLAVLLLPKATLLEVLLVGHGLLPQWRRQGAGRPSAESSFLMRTPIAEFPVFNKPVEFNVTLRGRQIDGSKISAKMPYLMPYLGAFFKYDSTGLSVQGNYVDAQWYPSTGF